MKALDKNIIFILFAIFVVFLWFFVAVTDIRTPKTVGNGCFNGNFISNDSVSNYGSDFLKAASSSKQVKMLFFGDMMLDRHVKERINGKINYLFSGFGSSSLELLDNYDLIGANLEGAVTNDGAHYLPDNLYDFAFEPGLVKQLKDYNFNFFTIANNHLADQGERGIMETRENLDNLGFFYVGCQDKQVDDCSAKIIDINDRKIGMVAYSQVYGLIDQKAALDQIRILKASTSKVIVNIHWGKEYEHNFDGIQQGLAHAMIDAGADLIIGHHPHVVQGMELYNGKPIFYSLGNFIFDQYFSADTQEGLALGAVIKDKKMDLHLFPFKSKASQVSLITEEGKRDFYNKFIKWSKLNEKYIEMVRIGKLEL